MKAVRLLMLVLVLSFGSGVRAQEFIIGAHLDPYTVQGDTALSDTLLKEYFDDLKRFGLNRVIGWADSRSTGQALDSTLGRLKIIPWNSVGIYGANPPKNREVEVTTQAPRTLEQFTTYGWHMILEVEKDIREENLKGFGYGFDTQTGEFFPDSLRALTGPHLANYLFAGPGGFSEIKQPGLWVSPKAMSPGTWGRADYVLKLGIDTAGVSDTATVARLVVYNANHYRIRYIDHGHFPAIVRDTATCITDSLHRPDTIFLCQQTTKPTGRPCGPVNYQLKFDDPVLFNDSTSPITVADAFVRDLKKSDFCQAGQWETLSVHFFQTKDEPFQYSLFWTNRVSLTADKIIVSNDTGRVLFSTNDTVFTNRLGNYYAALQDQIPRQFLTDEPYSGSFPVLRRGKDLISSPLISSPRKPTSVIGGYNAPRIDSYGWDILNSVVQPSEFNLEVYPLNCKMPPDSSTTEAESCNIQFGFAKSTPHLAFLSSRAKQPQINKPFWPWVQLFGFYGDYEPLPVNGWRQQARPPTYNEVKAQVNLALAYGAKGILYFQYTPTGERDNAPLPPQAMSIPPELRRFF